MARPNSGLQATRQGGVPNYSRVSSNDGANQARLEGAETQGGAFVILTTDDLVVAMVTILKNRMGIPYKIYTFATWWSVELNEAQLSPKSLPSFRYLPQSFLQIRHHEI